MTDEYASIHNTIIKEFINVIQSIFLLTESIPLHPNIFTILATLK